MSRRKPLVIAHRGASGYLPEHTLEAKALAHAMGADFLEQDVVLSRDGVPLVLHDVYLDSTTNVAQQFPGRARADGHYYAMDFELEEIRCLRVHERCESDSAGRRKAVYPGRFPPEFDFFRIPTLAEEIDFIAGLDQSCGRSTGLYIELKSPNRHRAAGLDLPTAVLAVLENKGYAKRSEQVFLQCFDDRTLQRLRDELQSPLPLIQLIADHSWGEDSEVDYDFLRSAQGLAYIATYADGIGPWLSQIYRGKSSDGTPQLSPLIDMAHARNLLVHPYTFRRDDLPPGMSDFQELLDLFIGQLGIDGLFTDFPDTVCSYLQQRIG